MAKTKNSEKLFKKLTRLFKSGPIVKRKLRALDTTIAVPDKTKSSGTLLFQKSLSPTYASITANAYNLSERLSRYQDFQEMEYSVDGATKIPQLDGTFKTIKELAEECKNDPNKTFYVYSYDHEKKQIVPALGKQARQTCVDHAWKITFDNGKTIIASAEHRLMLRDGTYRKVEDIQPGDAMMPFYRKDLFENAKEGTKGYQWVYTMDDRFKGWTKEHQLVAEFIEGRNLTEDECVHHMNFVKTDNRPENLRIMTNSDHNSLHASINNKSKWSDENNEWIEKFKVNHASWMRDNAPTRRTDITFAKIIQVAEKTGFDISSISNILDVSTYLIHERLVSNGFSSFDAFKLAYEAGSINTNKNPSAYRLTRELSLDEIKDKITEDDTKRSMAIKLNCTVNVLDKFLNRRINISWSQLREQMGLSTKGSNVGRPKGSTKDGVKYQDVTNVMERGLSRPRLAKKLNISENAITRILTQNGFSKYSEFRDSYENCKVSSIEYHGEIPLYDLTVDGYKNFATDSIISHNTPEIASALDIYCLAPDTVIPMLNGEKRTVKELYDQQFKNFEVYSYDINANKFVPGNCTKVVKTGENQKLFKVTFNDGLYVRLTENHLVLTSCGEYKRVKDLRKNDNIRSLYTRISSYEKNDRIDGCWSEFINNTNHQVVSVEFDGIDDVYDLQVDEFHNFAISGCVDSDSYVVVHNSDETVSQDDKGRVLHIFSENEKIRQILEDLFYNTLNVEFNLRSWVRNLPVRKDTYIPLLDGRNITIEQLSKEIQDNPKKDVWVYSVLEETGKLVPGRVNWCGLTRKDSELVRVWLDDETYVDSTPDHEFILRDGSRVQAQDLKPNQSLMPFYRSRKEVGKDRKTLDYERVYDPAQCKKVYTHRVMPLYEWKHSDKGKVVHHKNFNRNDNRPNNLMVMGKDEHQELHRCIANSYNSSELHKQHNIIRSQSAKAMWADSSRAQTMRENMRIKFDKKCLEYIIDIIKKAGKYRGADTIRKQLKNNDEFISYFKAINASSHRDILKSLNSSSGFLSLVRRASGFEHYYEFIAKNIPEIKDTPWFVRAKNKSLAFNHAHEQGVSFNDAIHSQSNAHNHKVMKVERLSECDDVYCMEVLGPNGDHDRHNFMVLSKTKDGQMSPSGVCVSNCKYGDLFLYNDVSPQYGVINAFPIPVNEIEREENYDENDPMAVRFRWITLGNRTLENWEVSHFRLLGNDMFLPYGSSVIEPSRRIWRQLILIEDAMLVYRVVRAPERRVFYIDVANIPTEDIPTYMEEQKRQLRSNQVIDRESSRVDLRYNPMPVHKDTPVPLLDGRTVTIEELSKERSDAPEKEQWVYSVQDKSQKLVPGKVVWCGKNYTTKKLVKVWLDDNSYVMTAPEHPFVMRDGSSKRADELVEGDSLMPFYRKDTEKGYETCYDPSSETYISTHKVVAQDVYPEAWKMTPARTVHHKEPWVEGNKKNNDPTNLEVMSMREHRKWHTEHLEHTLLRPDVLVENAKRLTAYNKSELKRVKTSIKNKERDSVSAMAWYNGSKLHKEHNENRRRGQKKSWVKDSKNRKKAMCWVIPDEVFDFICKIVKDNPTWGHAKVHSALISNKELMDLVANVQTTKRDVNKFSYGAWEGDLKRRGYDKLVGLRASVVGYKNHKVAKVEFVDVAGEDVYCMTVVGPNGEDDRHNFAVCGLKPSTDGLTNVTQVDGIIIKNSVDEDYFIPVRGGDTGTKIDTLQAGQNTGTVEDVAYIQKKLFASLKIPRAYLGYDEMLSCLVGETAIPLLNGETATIEELASKDWDKEQDIWVYSCDVKTGSMKPGKVRKAWKTKDVDTLYKITLDNGHVIRCTENHPFLCRSGQYLRADELSVGQSLMAQERKLSSKDDGDIIDGYEQVFDNATNEWKYTHKIVDAELCDKTIGKSRVVHHVDFDKRNNCPNNLQEMTWAAHRYFHSQNLKHTLLRPDVVEKRKDSVLKWLKSDAHRKFKSKMMRKLTTTPGSVHYERIHSDDHKEKMSEVMKANWGSDQYRTIKAKQSALNWEDDSYRRNYIGDQHWVRVKNKQYDLEWLVSFCKENDITSINQWRKEHKNSISSVSPVGMRFVKNLIVRNNYENWCDFANNKLGLDVPVRGKKLVKNRLNFSIDDLREFCVENKVELISQWMRHHPKSVCDRSPVSGTVVKRVLRENGFASFNEFKKTLKYNHKVAKIEIIKLDNPVGVYDVEVDRYHNFLVVPTTGEHESGIYVHNSKATLAQEDIRFSRSIAVIQKTVIAELNKLAIIHLYSNGFENDDLINFNLKLSNPSTVAQQQKLELWRTKFEIAGSVPEGMGSKPFVYRKIWDLTDEEIDTINNERLRDKITDAAIEGAGEGGEEFGGGSAGGGGGGLFGGGGDDLGGEDEDIFGDEGGDDLGGDEGTDEEPPEENAGEEPEEDEEPGIELIISADDVDDEEKFKLPSADTNKPIQASPQLKKTLYNRSRRRTHGASKTHLPDFNAMTSHTDREDTLTDPYDNNYLKSLFSNPLGESNAQQSMCQPKLGKNMLNMLKKMPVLNAPNNGLLSETGKDVQNEIDSVSMTTKGELIFEVDDLQNDDDNELVITENDDLNFPEGDE